MHCDLRMTSYGAGQAFEARRGAERKPDECEQQRDRDRLFVAVDCDAEFRARNILTGRGDGRRTTADDQEVSPPRKEPGKLGRERALPPRDKSFVLVQLREVRVRVAERETSGGCL